MGETQWKSIYQNHITLSEILKKNQHPATCL